MKTGKTEPQISQIAQIKDIQNRSLVLDHLSFNLLNLRNLWFLLLLALDVGCGRQPSLRFFLLFSLR